MFAVYASEGNIENPLASLAVGERPEPVVPEGWVRVKVSHASLNRHDIFTLMGVTAQADPIVFPMILGNDGAGTLDDGSEVIIYPLMGAPDWRAMKRSIPTGIFSASVCRARSPITSRSPAATPFPVHRESRPSMLRSWARPG